LRKPKSQLQTATQRAAVRGILRAAAVCYRALDAIEGVRMST